MADYEHIGMRGPHIQLPELITNSTLTCHCPTCYTGKNGELWYVHLLQPLEPEHAIHWIAIRKRTILQCDGPNDRTRLHHLLKYRPEPNYWIEFVFNSYHHYQDDAVFLTASRT